MWNELQCEIKYKKIPKLMVKIKCIHFQVHGWCKSWFMSESPCMSSLQYHNYLNTMSFKYLATQHSMGVISTVIYLLTLQSFTIICNSWIKSIIHSNKWHFTSKWTAGRINQWLLSVPTCIWLTIRTYSTGSPLSTTQ